MGIVPLLRRLNSLECKGLCRESCGKFVPSSKEVEDVRAFCEKNEIPFLPFEDNTLKAYWKYIAEDFESIWCPYLSDEGRCRIYEARPMICRVWGGSVGGFRPMICPHGCVPEGGYFTREETDRLIDYAKRKGITTLDRFR